jgi:hypothetical protein
LLQQSPAKGLLAQVGTLARHWAAAWAWARACANASPLPDAWADAWASRRQGERGGAGGEEGEAGSAWRSQILARAVRHRACTHPAEAMLRTDNIVLQCGAALTTHGPARWTQRRSPRRILPVPGRPQRPAPGRHRLSSHWRRPRQLPAPAHHLN